MKLGEEWHLYQAVIIHNDIHRNAFLSEGFGEKQLEPFDPTSGIPSQEERNAPRSRGSRV
jgi:hypothetical protein